MTLNEELETKIQKLEKRLRNLTIVGAHGVLVSGHFEQGYDVDVRRRGTAATGTSGACCYCDGTCALTTQSICESAGGTWQGDGTVCSEGLCPPTGACCIGEDCSIVTEDCCINAGGTYQGDDTTCDPNPCTTPTGACCVGEVCTIETEDDCTGMGGVYQGDGTDCDPNPCELPTCTCYFGGFEFGGRYLTATAHTDGSVTRVSPSAATQTWTADSVTEKNPDTCEVTCTSFSGSGTLETTCDTGSGTFAVESCHAPVCVLCSGNCSFSGVMVTSAPYQTGGYLEWSLTGIENFCDLACSNFSDFWNFIKTITVISDTVQETHWFFDDGFGFVIDITQTITLSDPCTPP